jgi:hypothetical protein
MNAPVARQQDGFEVAGEVLAAEPGRYAAPYPRQPRLALPCGTEHQGGADEFAGARSRARQRRLATQW